MTDNYAAPTANKQDSGLGEDGMRNLKLVLIEIVQILESEEAVRAFQRARRSWSGCSLQGGNSGRDCSQKTRRTVVKVLKSGTRELRMMVCDHHLDTLKGETRRRK